MIFYPFKVLLTGIVIGVVVASLSGDYVIIRRKKYEQLKNKEK